MRIALIIDDYLPHSTRVGAKMFHELATELTSQGHDVTVITPHFENNPKLITNEFDGVQIWRFRSGPIKDIGKVKRAINETLLSFNAWSAIKKKVNSGTFELVIYYSPSIFFGGLVSRIKNRCNCPAYLVLRDFFPQWAVDAGMIRRGSSIEKYFRFFEHKSYRQANMIGVMSEKNLELFRHSSDDQYPSTVLRNWASLTPHVSTYNTGSIRTRLGLEDKVIYFYGGNIGHAQDMGNLMRLAKAMQSYKDAHFLFVGQGDEVKLINELAMDWQLKNFSYLPSVDQAEFKNILTQIDVGLFSLSANHTAHNFPGKLLGYMVQSIPILGSVNEGNDLIEIVNKYNAGLITNNGQDDFLLKNAIALYESKKYRDEIGKNAFDMLGSEFSVKSIADAIITQSY